MTILHQPERLTAYDRVKFPCRVTFLQYSGDFRDAAERLERGGPELYRAQRYTVDYVHRLAHSGFDVTVITGLTDTRYDVVLESGVRAIGAGFQTSWRTKSYMALVRDSRPERIILRTPRIGLLRGVAALKVPTLALLADSLQSRSFKDRLKKYLASHYLNSPTFELVANHGRNAAAQFIAAGIDERKVVAWDFPQIDKPHDRSAKARPSGATILYVGALTADKGVDDLLDAFAHCSIKSASLHIVGEGDRVRLERKAVDLNVKSRVAFLGRMPNDKIIDKMRSADVVVVPSRHACAEGMPLTIYEAYCSRTPLIVSDHPMFLNNVQDGVSGLIFPAGDFSALSSTIERVLSNNTLYSNLSDGSLNAWEDLQIEPTWGQLIDKWLTETLVP